MFEGVHSQYRAERQRLVETKDLIGGDVATLEDTVRTYGDSYASPTYPRLRAFPTLTGEPLFSRTAPGGSMEQMLLKAWVIDIYSRWESMYRNQLKHENRHLRGAIRPLQQVLGDLGHIRNDLFHNGIAKRNESGRCEILRWFKVGEAGRRRGHGSSSMRRGWSGSAVGGGQPAGRAGGVVLAAACACATSSTS